MDVIKCDCGNYAYIDEIVKSVASGTNICPKCSIYCPNCNNMIGVDEVLYTNKCINCDEDF